jgi:hypothetical protein
MAVFPHYVRHREVVFSYSHTIMGGSGRGGQMERMDFPGKPGLLVPFGLSALRFGGLQLRNDPTRRELIAYAEARGVHDH